MNDRELALLIWIGAALVVALSSRSIRKRVVDAVAAVVHPKVLIALLGTGAWVVGLVALGRCVGLWGPELLSATVVWFPTVALGLLFNIGQAVSDEAFFRSFLHRAVSVVAFMEFFVNLYVFSLWVELFLLPLVVMVLMASAVAELRSYRGVARQILDALTIIGGMALVAYVTWQLIANWGSLEIAALIRPLALPVWLTLGILPLAYLLAVIAAYERAFLGVKMATTDPRKQLRAKTALRLVLRCALRDIGAFPMHLGSRLANSASLHDAVTIVEEFRLSLHRERERKAAAAYRLKRFAGADGVDNRGRRMDQREFEETKAALESLASAQAAWYRNRGKRYRLELVDLLGAEFERKGLGKDHGISLHVSTDGQAWWAWRQTVSGWCFAIGAAGPPPDLWLHDGRTPSNGPPGGDAGWRRATDSGPGAANW